jgi:uncharacterized membrane protein YcaP (DUF421 family)
MIKNNQKVIYDNSTKEDRLERGKPKDEKFRKLLREISYKNDGEIFLKSLNNACLKKLQNDRYYQVV